MPISPFNPESTRPEQVTGTESTQANTQQHVDRYLRVWDTVLNHGQLDVINTDHFAPDVEFNTRTGMISGVEQVKDYYRKYLQAFTNRQFTVFDTIAQGDKLVNYWRFQGKSTTSDETVDVIGLTLVHLRNGKIAMEQDFVEDTFFQKE